MGTDQRNIENLFGETAQSPPTNSRTSPRFFWGGIVLHTMLAGALYPAAVFTSATIAETLVGQSSRVGGVDVVIVGMLVSAAPAGMAAGIVAILIAFFYHKLFSSILVEFKHVWVGIFTGGSVGFTCSLWIFALLLSKNEPFSELRLFLLSTLAILVATAMGQYFGGRGARWSLLEDYHRLPVYKPMPWLRFQLWDLGKIFTLLAIMLTGAKLTGLLTEFFLIECMIWALFQWGFMRLLLRWFQWRYTDKDRIALARSILVQSPKIMRVI